jgi:hypothetical protein
MAALIHAAGVIHSDDVANPRCGDSFFESGVNLNGSGQRTRFAARAYEDVMTVLAHADKLQRWATRHPLPATSYDKHKR